MTLPRATTAVVLAVVAFSLAGSVAALAESAWQYSTIAALSAGAYDGDLPAGELRRHGDFGLGSFNALDGEMIVLDRQVWQVPASGRPRAPPIASVCRLPSWRALRRTRK